ncbi:Type II/IV secretion system ATPase TadZ/CpaE, associated with Flp pilus assembly [Photobacterium rosenbergii]|uniref:Type II/IV secretion system ATPase TadZ/CpaE, associated with Flp pilus assembly n=1 Tax=Photobacterium rosenbergii TaxID=294936 RepID=A0A2T3NJW5_9GAMM|nr:AAA family ATPase [Photobacterium rosenbergii]PSW15814.1 Type II/IV secretion system ATPase TadZ/CpaE, associated with Flp pilus assembly [Photobacterium rosenbergii]
MNTTHITTEKDLTLYNEKKPLATSINIWTISDDDLFIDPLSYYSEQWSNAHFTFLNFEDYCNKLKNQSNYVKPDLVIIDAKSDWVNISNNLKKKISKSLPILLITDDTNTEILRNALKLEIKDVLSIPFDESELDNLIIKCSELKSINRKQAKTSIFINAKGGMGASIIATSISHILALDGELTVLIDPDAQFGSSSGLLSLIPKYILSDALQQVNTLDEIAISGILTKHDSGLRFIPNRSDHLYDSINDINEQAFGDFLAKLKGSHEHIIIDLSRGLEKQTLPAVADADNVFIVIQQNIPAIKEASILIKQLKHLFGFNQEKIKVIVNRYSKNIDINPDEIKKSLHISDIILVPNDYISVSSSTNLGELLATHFEKKPIVKTLKEITSIITNKYTVEENGFKKVFSFFRR